MKKLLFTGIVAVSMVSCEAIKDELQIKDVEVTTPIEDVEVPFAGIEGLTIPAIATVLNVDIDEKVKEETGDIMDLENIKKANLKGFVIKKSSSTPEDADLSVFKNAEIWVKSPNFEETKVAVLVNNTNTDELVFDTVDNVDLVPYMKEPKGQKALIIKNITCGETNISYFNLTLEPTWSLTIGFE